MTLTTDQRIDVLIESVDMLCDQFETQGATLTKILEAMQKPPTDDLPDLFRGMIAAVTGFDAKLDGIAVTLAEVVRRAGG